MKQVGDLRRSLDYYIAHGRCDDDPVKKAIALAEKSKLLIEGQWPEQSGLTGIFCGMDGARYLLDHFYILLHNQGLLESVYRLHPNPTFLSKASRSHLWAMNQTHLQNDRLDMSLLALSLGGFPTLSDIQESFRDFKVKDAPNAEMCRSLLENTFAAIEFFSDDPLSLHHGGKYFTVLLGKLIDEGESSWAFDFLDRNLDVLEQFSPVQYTRKDEPEGFSFKEKFLVHLQNYLRCDRLLSKLAEADEEVFSKVMASNETHDHIMWEISARKGFELSSIPLDQPTCKRLVTSALSLCLVEEGIKNEPLRLVDLARIEEAWLSTGMTSTAFMQLLRKQPYFKQSLKGTESLLVELSQAGGNFEALKVLNEKWAGKSLDFITVAAYANSSLRKALLENLPALSPLLVMRDHDAHVIFEKDRTHVTTLEIRALIHSTLKGDSDLCGEWKQQGLFKAPKSVDELSHLRQEDLAKFRKLAHGHFSDEELRKISWTDHRIRESFFGQDLGL
ncbi:MULTISPECIES: hypothetical protein [Pseudomonas]|uniref:hypothetical protein n=1 Tax=Pseudomonas TaxID=286 RepID=UPI001F136C20|nr:MULTISPECIES: hypothetical protein [Pseudomonas]